MSDIKDLLNNVDLEDWLDWEGIDYRRAGSGMNLNVRECPFCHDNRWKVYINKDKKLGLCFHGDCSARFNLFTFARQHLDTDNKGVVSHFTDYTRRFGIMMPAPTLPLVFTPKNKEWQLPESSPLPTGDGKTHPFLINRHITLDTQAAFGLRWCKSGSFSYVDLSGRNRMMNFDNRIIIPVFDLEGGLQTFIGRDTTGVADKRYLFPATIPGTGRYLFGGNLLPETFTDLVVCEGPFDVMATRQAIQGYQEFRAYGVVGSFGLSIGMSDQENSNDQLGRLLKLRSRGLERITIMWDGERGAFLAAINSGERLISHGFKVRIATLPADRDPNEVRTAVVREAIENAQELTPLTAIAWKLVPPYK